MCETFERRLDLPPRFSTPDLAPSGVRARSRRWPLHNPARVQAAPQSSSTDRYRPIGARHRLCDYRLFDRAALEGSTTSPPDLAPRVLLESAYRRLAGSSLPTGAR